MLDQLGPLFLDLQCPGAELRVGVPLVLLADRLDRFGLYPGLGRVVDAARKVTVRERGGLRRKRAGQQPHVVLLSCRSIGIRIQTVQLSNINSPGGAHALANLASRGSRTVDGAGVAAGGLAAGLARPAIRSPAAGSPRSGRHRQSPEAAGHARGEAGGPVRT